MNNTTNSDFKFTTVDPLKRTVVLKSSTWDEHIADRHNEQDIEAIKNNISRPHMIFMNTQESKSSDPRNIYLSYTLIDNKLYNIKTVVEFKSIEGSEEIVTTGEVVTNYVLRKINEKEIKEGDVLYDSSKS